MSVPHEQSTFSYINYPVRIFFLSIIYLNVFDMLIKNKRVAK